MKVVWIERAEYEEPKGMELPDEARLIIEVSPNVIVDIENNSVRIYEPDDVWITTEGKLFDSR
jgi:hypothetical protein